MKTEFITIEFISPSFSQTPERDFTLKVSALEIYNETVVDLLNRESGVLRLLDDPEVLSRKFFPKHLQLQLHVCFNTTLSLNRKEQWWKN